MSKVAIKVNKDRVYAQIKCPGCKSYHVVAVKGAKSNWGWNEKFDRPTFQPSILCKFYEHDKVVGVCHSFVADGKIQFLTDSTHDLAGQTVELPEHDEWY